MESARVDVVARPAGMRLRVRAAAEGDERSSASTATKIGQKRCNQLWYDQLWYEVCAIESSKLTPRDGVEREMGAALRQAGRLLVRCVGGGGWNSRSGEVRRLMEGVRASAEAASHLDCSIDEKRSETKPGDEALRRAERCRSIRRVGGMSSDSIPKAEEVCEWSKHER